MDTKSLKKAIADVDSLADHAKFILDLVKPSVDITVSKKAGKKAESRFGGHPFLPADFEWPEHDIGEYAFLGQINFAEITDRPKSLPASGLLTLFYAFDEDGECFWGDDGYIRGFYWKNYDGHVVFDSPTDDAPKSKKIKLTGGIDIPRHCYLRDDWPFDPDELYELTEDLDLNDEYLLGYPSFTSLGYDPTPKGGWMSLLTVHSLDEFDWCWHDGDKLMVFIESKKLAKRDFSYLKSDAG